MRKEETVAVSAMRAGFTLIEILVAVAIIGILGTTAAIGIPRILENSKIKAAKVGVDNLKAAVVAYNIEKGKRFVVISAGPDGEFGGDDDIRSDVTKRSTGND